MTYTEKLKDPRWQRKRLEVLNTAGFKCEECGSGSSTLHVHHCYYEKGLMPWDYVEGTLKCLCESCHKERQSVELNIQKWLCDLTTRELKEFHDRILGATLAIGVDAMVKEVDDIMFPCHNKA